MQAQDRCHRIGQTKPVMIFTLVAKNTIDEKIIKQAECKKKLERVVMKKGKILLELNFNSILQLCKYIINR